MGHLWGTAADAGAELAAEAEAAAAAAAAGAYRHVEYTVYEEVADDGQSSEDARISLAELKPLEQAVRTAHAEVRNLGARSRSTAPLPPPYRPLTAPLPPPYRPSPPPPLTLTTPYYAPKVLRLELGLEVATAAEAAGAVGEAVGHAGEEARHGVLRTELVLKKERGAEVEAQARYLVTTPTMAQR